MRHESHFSKPTCTCIRLNQPLQNFLAFARVSLYNLPTLKTHMNPFNHRPLVRERLRRGDGAIRAILVRRCKNLFGGHVRDAIETVPRRRSAAKPQMIVGQAQLEIGAGTTLHERRITLLVHHRSAFLQECVVLLPSMYRIGSQN